MIESSGSFVQWGLSGGMMLAGLSLFGLFIKQIGPWSAQRAATETRLLKQTERRHARCEAHLVIVKHRERNSRQLCYSMLHLFDMLPGAGRDGALEVVRKNLAEIERVELEELAVFMKAGFDDDEEQEL